MTHERWRECRACGKRLLDFGAMERPGRNRQYCDDACRQASYRARKADPQGWARDQAARDRRARNRDKRVRDYRGEWERGARRMAALTEAEFRRLLAKVGDEAVPDGEQLLSDRRIRNLLLRALVSDSEHEASTALAVARRIHRGGVTVRS